MLDWRKGLKGLGTVSVLAAVALACSSSDPNPSEHPPNILVLVPDTIRGDHLSVNGYPKLTSPNIDAFAREGVNYSQAITVAPRTWQSHASILTGSYPPQHGVRFLFDNPISQQTPILVAELGEAGYETASFAQWPFLKALTGGRAFDHFYSAKDDAGVLRKVAEWISLERNSPFLAFVQTSGGHWPYSGERWLAPEDDCDNHDHAFNEGKYGTQRGNPGEGLHLVDAKAVQQTTWTLDRTMRTRKHRIAHYDAEIRETDALIGSLIDHMRSTGLLEKTIVVLTSDHGESFGEHGYIRHGPRVDEPAMRVPLIIRYPSSHPAHDPGRRVDTLVRVIDIMPTLLQAVGVPIPPEVEGRSLIEGTDAPGWIYGEAGRSYTGVDPDRHLPGVMGKHRMIRTDRWKLVHVPKLDGGVDRLFDLHGDPEERFDVAERHPDIVKKLRARLDPILARDRRPEGAQTLSPQEAERLRALGYME